jgi:eIF-2B alpha/beta/delta-like uncharacterized protein
MAEIFRDIKSMKIQGARHIALASLRYLLKFSEKNGFGRKFGEECRKLLAVRPTAALPYNVISAAMRKKSRKSMEEMIGRLESSSARISMNSRKIFKKKSTVITHCHSHEAISFLLASAGKISKVYVTETRPKMQGIETAHDLSKKIKTYFIIDSAAGYYMPKADMVIVGADALRREGVVNKIGTLMIAVVASEFGKPVYVIAETMKIDKRPRIVIEQRACSEVTKIKNVHIENPTFDLTPWKYITAVVTERGVMRPQQIKRMIR